MNQPSLNAEATDYREFVSFKEAPPYELDTYKFRLLHFGLGLATELLELQQSSTRTNTIEELEDNLWYLTLGSILLTPGFPLPESYPNKLNQNHITAEEYAVTVETLVSHIKKEVIYNKAQPDLPGLFLDTYEKFLMHCRACNITIPQLRHGNRIKLDQRYKEAFTAQESEDRADKRGEDA